MEDPQELNRRLDEVQARIEQQALAHEHLLDQLQAVREDIQKEALDLGMTREDCNLDPVAHGDSVFPPGGGCFGVWCNCYPVVSF